MPQNELTSSDCPATRKALSETIAIIPMLNEEDSIGKVLDDLPEIRQVIVVDNGCTDDSPQIAAQRGATVVKQPKRGYGAACLKGIETVETHAVPAPKFILFIDADYSDHGEEAVHLLKPLADNESDFVIGSRMKGKRERGAMPVQAAFGNWLASTMMWLFWGAKYSDLGPFRAIRWSSLQRLKMQDENFGWTVEMQIKALQANLRYIEVPVSYRRRLGASKISGTIAGTIKAGYKIIFTILKYRFSKSPDFKASKQ